MGMHNLIREIIVSVFRAWTNVGILSTVVLAVVKPTKRFAS